MLHYILFHHLRLHYFIAILSHISLLMLHYFNASAIDVASFEFALFFVALLSVILFYYYTINSGLYKYPAI